MGTVLSNERRMFHAETSKTGGTVKLSGEVSVNEEGVIQNFSGQVSSVDTGQVGTAPAYGSFYYALNGNRASQNIDVPAEYSRETFELLDQALSEISNQLTEA